MTHANLWLTHGPRQYVAAPLSQHYASRTLEVRDGRELLDMTFHHHWIFLSSKMIVVGSWRLLVAFWDSMLIVKVLA